MTFSIDRPPIVMDASFAIEHLVGPHPAISEHVESWLGDRRGLLAPSGFWAEVANALLIGNRLPAEEVRGHLEELVDLGVEASERGQQALREAVALAAEHRLTVYDALYLEMAIDTDATLATLDRDLARAAAAEGVELEPIGEPGEPGEPA